MRAKVLVIDYHECIKQSRIPAITVLMRSRMDFALKFSIFLELERIASKREPATDEILRYFIYSV